MEKGVPLIEAKNLVKTYGEGEGLMYALNDVSVTVYEHDFLVILGGSGSGKSTLLNMIGAIDKVDSGQIIVNDRDIVKLNDKGLTLYRRNEVGFVYQFFNLINDVTVYQNVTLSPGSRNKERALSLLDRVGLLDKKDKFPRQLSAPLVGVDPWRESRVSAGKTGSSGMGGDIWGTLGMVARR